MNPIPQNEDLRLKALQSYDVMDTLGEEAFDRITQLASVICGVPIALVSLIDENRQWFKSKVGIDVPETPRDISFCQHAIMGQEIFEVENAIEDERFKDNPLVQGFPNIRFYAGFPLEDPDGYNLGTLCVIDEKPHKLDDNQRLALSVLGKEVVAQLVARKNVAELKKYKNLYDLSIDLICIAGTDGYFKSVNTAFTKSLGYTETELLSKPFFEFIHPEDIESTEREIEKLSQGHKTINFVCRYRTKSNEYRYLQWVTNPEVETGNLFAIARDITVEKKNENIQNELKITKVLQSEILAEISLFNVGSDLNFKEIVQFLSEKLTIGLRVSRASFWLFENNNLVCENLFSKGLNEHFSGSILNNENYPNYLNQLKLGKPIIASNVFENEYTKEFIDDYFVPNQINSMLDVPIWENGELIGVICCECIIQNREWSDSDVTFARTFADAYSLKKSEIVKRESDFITKQTTSRLQNLLANFQDAVLVEDENRHIVITNKMFCDLFSIPVQPDLLVGADCSQSAEQSKNLFTDPEAFVKSIDTILSNRKIVKGEQIRMVNGKILERDYVPIYIDEVYNGHLWKYRDVTESIILKEELENAKNELNITFETISEGVVVQKPSGEIISCNPAACRILMLTEDQLTGKSSLDPDWNCIKEDGTPFPGDEHPSMAAIKSKESIYNVIMGVRIHQGTITWISINAELLPNDKGVVTTFTDISERKEIENNKLKLVALEASNKIADESLKAREEFLANMSHEIRTPMNAIIGLSNLMDKAGELNPKQTSYLDVIKLNSDNLLTIINDILDYSKLESGKFEIERTNVPLKDTIYNIVTSLRVLADKKDIKIHLEYDQKLPIFIKTDGLRISQIMTNLISNAIKFSNNKDINVEIIQNFISDNKVSFTTKIIDQGIGIANENIENITKPFTQETSSTTRKYGGTGLGLSIVSKLLKFLGSELIIESEEGKGSTFSFTLFKEIRENITKFDLTDHKITGKYALLLVEDNQFNQLVAIDSLMEWNPNFEITVANHGEEALKALHENAFDLVLMDIQMPVMDGYEATRAIRLGDEEYNNIPIIAMTAHTSSMEIEKCINMGMNGFLSKPFNEKDLHQKIASIIYDESRESQSSNHLPKTSESNVQETKTEMVTNKVVDLDAIVNFTKGKIDRIEKMVNMFLVETPSELLKLSALFEQRDYPSLRTLAHSFKPKYAYMGMQHLSDIAKSIEHNADLKTNETEIEEGIKELIDQSKKAYEELTIFLKEEQRKNS
jgi:two-component system, sensor histidine kinase